ncbi:putative subtilase family protein isoform X1 [Zea mays]|uniref:putative subtilase family protein isoform X1 n=1 Tax=Zea mays TaxID=4577 RepID=UPI0009A94EA4|nr:putative subtilase family protein isoform X1 [Zea mays]|eukprot:XP_020402986.1 putative subtilase family protein isoform X1 [Zea mays]
MGWRPHVVSASSSALVLQFLVLLLPLPLPLLSADASSSQTTTTIYVVYMGEKKHDDPSVVMASHHAALTSVLGSKDEALRSIVYSYKHGFSGFAAKLTQPQAEELTKYPGVVSVKPNAYHHVHTTRSWDFLGMSYGESPSLSSSSRLLRKAKYGEDVIVGVIDSGIWPESPSFDDSGYGPVPKRWKGVCQTGQAFNASNCNRKVIGARWYGADVSEEDLKAEYRSARDANGHGTHTASTIAGSPVRGASHAGGGLAAGIARGGAPRARLAIYKVCHDVGGGTSCGDASILAALDAAIGDGVDVLSLSLGGGSDEVYRTLHVVAAGITVVFSAGNDGPVPQSVTNALPWLVTVAATTVDRTFPTVVTLGDGETKLVGQSLYYRNRSAAASTSNDDFAWRHLMAFTGNVARISPAATMVGPQVASPRIATFSSRGPSAEFPSVLKPDIAAPGVSILAAKRDSYVLLSGTSMACPHVSAVVALLKSVHPDWSPAMIKSAIVTTASVTDRFGLPIQANSVQRKPADAFDMGGGLIAPDRAMDPGLVYDIQPEEYKSLDDRVDRLNLPSIAVPNLMYDSVTVSRTVTNVGPVEATYRAVVEAPAGVAMDVAPPVIAFERGGVRNATFKVTFVAKQRVQGGYAFGSLTWLDDAKRHSVRIPVAVRTVVRDFVADVSR